jgi:hypothetical protein
MKTAAGARELGATPTKYVLTWLVGPLRAGSGSRIWPVLDRPPAPRAALGFPPVEPGSNRHPRTGPPRASAKRMAIASALHRPGAAKGGDSGQGRGEERWGRPLIIADFNGTPYPRLCLRSTRSQVLILSGAFNEAGPQTGACSWPLASSIRMTKYLPKGRYVLALFALALTPPAGLAQAPRFTLGYS